MATLFITQLFILLDVFVLQYLTVYDVCSILLFILLDVFVLQYLTVFVRSTVPDRLRRVQYSPGDGHHAGLGRGHPVPGVLQEVQRRNSVFIHTLFTSRSTRVCDTSL